MKRVVMLFLMLTGVAVADAKVSVVTTLPDLADLARRIGGDRVEVDHIVRGDQNPHFIEVKPSYMMKLKKADIFLMNGMDLEMWAQQIIDGSRNSKLDVVDMSRPITKLEVPTQLDASQGDVHRYGNPHYWLDPRNIRLMAETIVQALTRAAPGDAEFFRANAQTYLRELDGHIARWEAAMAPFAGASVVTFHRSWTYFAHWLNLRVADHIEPKPGIPPTPGHTAELIALVRDGKIKVIVVEPFYDPGAAQQIASAGGSRVVRLTTSVGGVDAAKDYISMMEYNISTLRSALQ